MAVTDSSREACFKGSFVSRALKPVCSFKWPHSHVWREIKQMCGIGGIVRMLIPRSHLIYSCLHCIHPYFIHCVYPVPFLTSFTQVYSTPLSHLIYSCLCYTSFPHHLLVSTLYPHLRSVAAGKAGVPGLAREVYILIEYFLSCSKCSSSHKTRQGRSYT